VHTTLHPIPSSTSSARGTKSKSFKPKHPRLIPPKSKGPLLQSPAVMSILLDTFRSVPPSSAARLRGRHLSTRPLHPQKLMLPTQRRTLRPILPQLRDSVPGLDRSLLPIAPRCCLTSPRSTRTPSLLLRTTVPVRTRRTHMSTLEGELFFLLDYTKFSIPFSQFRKNLLLWCFLECPQHRHRLQSTFLLPFIIFMVLIPGILISRLELSYTSHPTSPRTVEPTTMPTVNLRPRPSLNPTPTTLSSTLTLTNTLPRTTLP